MWAARADIFSSLHTPQQGGEDMNDVNTENNIRVLTYAITMVFGSMILGFVGCMIGP